MARIDTYTAQGRLNPGSTPQVNLVNPVADELQKIGQDITQVAGVMQQRQEQRENFKVENDYRKLQLDLQSDMEKQAQEIAEGGDGFHDDFMTKVFKPKRDEFLASVPQRLQEKFSTLLADNSGADATDWSIKAAGVERDENYRWQQEQIGLTQEQMATAIGMNPDGYDAMLKDGLDLIETSSLPTPEKAKLRVNWENTAQVAILNTLLEKDPSGVLRELGYDPRQLSPTTQFELLARAVQWQESADNPTAVSGKGAIGLMQVMPGTAEEIAGEIGDENFPTGQSRDAVTRYMTNPSVNKRYGEYYLQKQLRAFAGARDPIEAALVAYNAGPGVAKKWVESGYDDKLLPKETRDYRDNIMATLTSSPVKGDPKSVKFEGLGKGTNPDLQNRVADAFATVGLTKVKVNSGSRTKAENDAVGGAKGSQHLTGNAMDIDVSGMKITDRIELIKALSAAGVTGIGVYANSIHADLGGRRAWGPDHHDGSIPAWARPVLGQHLNGTTPPPRAVAQRYASLPYDTRQQFTSKADQAISTNAAQTTKATAVQKVEVRSQMENNLAMIRATGQGDPKFDPTNVATILGEDDYMTYANKAQVAQKTFTAVSGISTMMPEDMEQRFALYEPTPGSSDFADQQQIQAAVQKEIDRVTRLRATQPDKAALEFPEVQQAYTQMAQESAAGEVTPATAQNYVKQMLDTQARIGISPAASAPISSDWALQIGRALSRVTPPTTNQKRDVNAVRDGVLVQYQSLHQVFGDYTDEVIVYALSEYKGISKDTADLITGYMTAISQGGDPFRLKAVSNSLETDNQEGFSLFGWYPFGGAPDNSGLSTEERLRQQDAAATEQ